MAARSQRWWAGFTAKLRTGYRSTYDPGPNTRSSLDREAPAWLVSLLGHVLLLLLLTLGTIYDPNQKTAVLLHAEMPEAQVAEVQREFEISPDPSTQPGAMSNDGPGRALAAALDLSEVSLMPVRDVPEDEGTVRALKDIARVSGPRLDQLDQVRGVPGMGVTGAAGAIDVLTAEILRSLELDNTLVVWIFDRSGSLEKQRQEIYGRFDQIYKELTAVSAGGRIDTEYPDEPQLLTSVVAFAADSEFLLRKPTDGLKEIKDAITRIRTDDSGVESIFGTICSIARRYQAFRARAPQRRVMLIVFTDEAGNDGHRLEDAVALCRKWDMPVYVVGSTAPFGREQAFVKWTDPDPSFNQKVQWAPVDRGPESRESELLRLLFPDSRPDEEFASFDSGFGPFALTRLCSESGGIYFTVHPNRQPGRRIGPNEIDRLASRISYFFDEKTMSPYRPDYISDADYTRLLEENKARTAIVNAARQSWLRPIQNPKTTFPFRDEADFVKNLREAQQLAARIEPALHQLYQILQDGLPDRPLLTGRRWQAGFDLAMGRVLAALVRTEGYNAILATAKQGMVFQDPSSDTWEIEPAETVTGGTRLEDMAEQARSYLNRVVAEHDGTPWSQMAKRELDIPLGWRFRERHTGVNESRAARNNDGRPRRNNPSPKPRPIRPPPNL